MKTLCKLVVENGNRSISNIEKELIKKPLTNQVITKN